MKKKNNSEVPIARQRRYPSRDPLIGMSTAIPNDTSLDLEPCLKKFLNDHDPHGEFTFSTKEGRK